MGKEDNLRPIVLSHEEAVKNGRAGGIASGEARRRRRDTREFLNAYLDSPAPPGLAAFLERMEVPEEMRTNMGAIVIRLFDRAVRTGDLKAANTLFEWAGILPNQDVIEAAEVAKMTQTAPRSKESTESVSDVILYDPATFVPPD